MPAMLGMEGPGAVSAAPVMVYTHVGGADMAQGTCSVEGCEKLRSVSLWCRPHYMRRWRTGDVGGVTFRPTFSDVGDRLEQFTAVEGECFIWTGPRDKDGYGKTSFEGRDIRTHRLVWTLANGAIPPGMSVLHSCDNPPCVRLSHLWLGTTKDNIRDMWAKGRHGRRVRGPDGKFA